MKPRIIIGDALTELRKLEPESVHCVITSPPYWRLRDYGTGKWEGGDSECNHKETTARNDGGRENIQGFHGSAKADSDKGAMSYRDTCRKCGAVRTDKQLGFEATPEEYTQMMVAVFREVRRVLRKDGALWLNMGDSYSHGGHGARDNERWPKQSRNDAMPIHARKKSGFKPKDLCGIPWRLAFALQADGWYLRSALPWVKRSAMPESATDRPASALEYVFLLTRSAHYFFDMDAVRQGQVCSREEAEAKYCKQPHKGQRDPGGRRETTAGFTNAKYNPAGRNLRDTDLYYQSLRPPYGFIFAGDEPVGLDVNPAPYADAHFATYPPKLVEPLILAGTSARGCCPECGAPWERIVKKAGGTTGKSWHEHSADSRKGMSQYSASAGHAKDEQGNSYSVETIGWQPICKCHFRPAPAGMGGGLEYKPRAPVPCTVLDPFAGSGTTLAVAYKLGRASIGIELNPEYAKLIETRVGAETPALPGVTG